MDAPWLRLLAVTLLTFSSLRGEVIRVPRDYVSIKSAVFAADDGDIIEVDEGYYFEGNVVLDKAITLRARNAFRAVVYADVESGFREAVFVIRAPAVIEGFIIKNGFRGIMQRGSPDVAWTAEHLAILNMREEAISINAAEGNIGRGTVRGVIIDRCGTGIGTNDAHSLDVTHCLIANCASAFSGYDHIQFRVDRTMIWNCGRAFVEDDHIPFRPACNTITRGAHIEVFHGPAVSGGPSISLIRDFFTDLEAVSKRSPVSATARGLALAIAGDVFLGLRRFSQALPLYEAALRYGEESESEEVILRAHTGLAFAHERLGNDRQGLEHYREAVQVIERFREKLPLRIFNPGFLQDKAQVYVAFISLLFDLHNKEPLPTYLEEAFACAERSRARGFLDSLEEKGLDFSSGISPEIVSEGKRLSERVSRYQVELQSANLSKAARQALLAELEIVENSYRDLMIRMRRDSPGDADRHYPGPLSHEAIRAKLLPKGTAMIEFVLGDACSFAFWTTQDSLSLVPLPPSGEILPLVERYLKFLTLGSPGRFLAAEGSHRLFDILLGGFRDEMAKGIKKIIVIPDGYLYYLPFESLIADGRDPTGRRRFLVEDFEICYGPSASALVRLSERNQDLPSRNALFIVSVPDLPSSSNSLFGYPISLPRLAHAREEVAMIARHFAENERSVLDGRQAEEERLKRSPLGDYRYIHFAVHGIFDDRYWRRSGLLLRREEDSAEDGVLQLRDIFLLDLNADLVVLSACRSAAGNIDTGEGIRGLTGGFLFAGSRAVLVSLWDIADRSTAKLMGSFYGHLRAGKAPSRALQEAKREMIPSPYGHPFHWAAFILIGDSRSYSISK